MDGSAPKEWTRDVQAAFEQKTGAKVEFKTHKWDGIQQKFTTALSESKPPDVIEIGNTQTSAYAATGGLAELGDLKKEIGADWTPTLNQSSVYEGKQYGAPWYFANRIVIYNKKGWAEASIKDTPKTRYEFLKDLDPLLAPGLMATSLFGFITAWNEYPLVLILNKSIEQQTLPLWVSQFRTAFGDDWGATMAASSMLSRSPPWSS